MHGTWCADGRGIEPAFISCGQRENISIDTIKLIAYRAETALAQLAREEMHRLDDARSLIRQLFRTEVDLIPDQQSKTLTVRLHPLHCPSS
jgi:hypothetical protein